MIQDSRFKIQDRGFTLAEILISVGILASVLLLSLPFILQTKFTANLDSATDGLITTLREAQSQSIAAEGDSSYGVYFDTTANPPTYTLYKGPSWASRDTSFNAGGYGTTTLPKGVTLSVSGGRFAHVIKNTDTGTCSGTTLTGCEFSIYDISNPAAPVAVGGVDLAILGKGVVISGKYAYLAKWDNTGTCSGTTLTGCEFSIYDISNPAAPVAVGGVDMIAGGNSIYLNGHYAYIAKNSHTGTCSGTTLTGCEFSIYDISNPAAPVAVGGVDMIAGGKDVYISNHYAYIAKSADTGTCSGTTLTGCEFSIYDISNPAAPVAVGGVDLADKSPESIVLSSQYAYIAKNTATGTCSGTTLTGCEFSIYDISNPAAPVAVGGVDMIAGGNDVYISGQYAYLVRDGTAGTCSGTTLTGCEFRIYDISNPASPLAVGGVDFPSTLGRSIYVSGLYAAISKSPNTGTCSGTTLTGCEFSIYDISNPAAPVAVGGVDLGDGISTLVTFEPPNEIIFSRLTGALVPAVSSDRTITIAIPDVGTKTVTVTREGLIY